MAFSGMNDDNTETYSSIGVNNSYGLGSENATIMQLRLDTTSLMTDIERFLSAKKTFIIRKGDQIIEEDRSVGTPLANDVGVASIMNIIRMRINSHTVQGNIDMNHYYDLVGRTRLELCDAIINKRYEWGIDDTDENMIIDNVITLFELFITRPINDGERDSYKQMFKLNETVKRGKDGAVQSFTSGMGAK